MINLALIGVGNWGNKILSEAKLVPGLSIKYICSPHIFSKKIEGNFSYYTDYKKLASIETLDGVIIATPVDKHFEIASYFIKHLIPVLVEKPFFKSVLETRKFLTLRDKYNVPCMFSKIYSFNQQLQKITKLNSKLGKIRSLEIKLGNREPNIQNRPIISEWLPHVFDILFIVSKKLPVSLSVIQERSSKKDRLTIHIKYDDFDAEAKVGWGFVERKRELDIKYEKGKISIKDLTKMSYGRNLYTPLFYELSFFLKVIEVKKVSTSDFDYSIDIMRLLEATELSLSKKGKEITIKDVK